MISNIDLIQLQKKIIYMYISELIHPQMCVLFSEVKGQIETQIEDPLLNVAELKDNTLGEVSFIQ